MWRAIGAGCPRSVKHGMVSGMTKQQLRKIEALARKVNWDDSKLRRETGIHVHRHPYDTHPTLADSVILRLEKEVSRMSGLSSGDAPATPATEDEGGGAAEWSAPPIRPAQRGYIDILLERTGLSGTEAAALIGETQLSALTLPQASKLIDELKALAGMS